MRTIFIHWHGPFSMNEVKCGECSSGIFSERLLGNGLYAVTGKLKGQRYSRLQYIGITERDYVKRWNSGHIVHQVSREQKIWLGSIAYGKRTREALELAESMLIFFNDEADMLNQRKKATAPGRDCTLISMFFKKTSEESYIKLPSVVRMLPEVLIWDKKNSVLRHKERLNFFFID